MFRNIKIGTKITAVVITIVLITVATISYLTYNLSKKSIERRQDDNLNVLANIRVDKINSYVTQIDKNAHLIASSELVKNAVINVNSSETTSNSSAMDPFGSGDPFGASLSSQGGDDAMDFFLSSSTEDDLKIYINDVNNAFEYTDIAITDPDGLTLFSTDIKKEKNIYPTPTKEFVSLANDSLIYSSTFIEENEFYIINGTPIKDNFDVTIGLVFIKFKISTMYNILQDYTGLGNSGEVVLGTQDPSGTRIIYLNPLRNNNNEILSPKKWENNLANATPIQLAIEGKNFAGKEFDYNGVPILAAWRSIPKLNWGLVTKINQEEVYSEIETLLLKFLFSGLFIALITSFISILFSKMLVAPVQVLKSTLDLVGQGILPGEVKLKSNDEVGQMASTVNHLVHALKRTAGFANQIGTGDFDAKFKPLGENDALGLSLITMRDNLVEAEKRDNERNWIVTGVAEIGEILRIHNNLEDLGDDVLKFIIKKIEAIQGALYIVEEDDDLFDEHGVISLKSSYAYNRKKYIQKDFKFAEGLVGQAAVEQDTIIRTEIPNDYVTLTSGILGDQKPTCILIVPLITNEKVYGVLEFAGFKRFSDVQIKFVEELSLILARTVFNMKVNDRTKILLEESQTMSTELQEKQEVLRQNAEEMQATQEELTRSNAQLEEQIEEVNRTQKRMQLLLENASEVITIYEEDETIRYISPSVEPILGYSQNELIDTKDIDFVLPEYVPIVKDMFKQLLDNPYEQVTVQYEYKTKSGKPIWIESTGTNFMSNPAIHGMIVNSTDITERRRAEQEQRMRSKMQALSENSPDLITRLENDGPISYINPVIEKITGKKPERYLNKNLVDTDINKSIIDQWLEIIENVKNTNENIVDEIDFISEEGKRIMHVNAIPEFDELKNLESVLVVSHDITERKLIELEVQNKNKKINDSINYAKRIQGAILPNTNIINRTLPDSFIFYKPKDVVSGDFPWYVRVGEDIYIAAVDCTGHGVPGALLSLIGYFLLNDIVRSRKISDPGIILDQLDEGVTTTLRQDQDDSKTKDGMDIALCKINTENRTVEYAGAHRPLYVMKNHEMEEIKGNKFAIGGGIYKNQTNFTNTKLSLKKGDSIYFCSDGFPDQFGGPENRKFGPKRTRQIIHDVHEKSMREASEEFEKQWFGWQGEEKQTDDVLLIGIKF
ncbi:MAG: PAS domain S-box protein [Cyclobacteriaceae bacterium]|nr:PAS domain S-box protein [Cyclobacteriaceae bacterium]